MSKTILAFAISFVTSGFAVGSDKEKADKLRKEIADLRSQLSAKEAELAMLDPVNVVDYLWTFKMKPGDAGTFGQVVTRPKTEYAPARIRVEKVVDKLSMIISIIGESGKDPVQVLVSDFDTTGVADGKTFPSPTFRVLGTKKVGDRTYAHVEPWKIPPKK